MFIASCVRQELEIAKDVRPLKLLMIAFSENGFVI